jgi:hypothetical protein
VQFDWFLDAGGVPGAQISTEFYGLVSDNHLPIQYPFCTIVDTPVRGAWLQITYQAAVTPSNNRQSGMIIGKYATLPAPVYRAVNMWGLGAEGLAAGWTFYGDGTHFNLGDWADNYWFLSGPKVNGTAISVPIGFVQAGLCKVHFATNAVATAAITTTLVDDMDGRLLYQRSSPVGASDADDAQIWIPNRPVRLNLSGGASSAVSMTLTYPPL